MAKIADRDQNTTAAVFMFANGKRLECEYDRLSDDMKRKVGIWGINHKVGDGFSSAQTVDEAYDMASAVWDGLLNGDWTVRTTGGILAEALSRASGETLEACREVIKAMDDKAKRKLAKNPAILAAQAEILKERAAGTGGDLSSLFGK